MLSEKQKEMFGEKLISVFQELENAILADIARRVNKEKRWTETAEIQANFLRDLGWSPYKIRIEVLRRLKADADYAAMLERNTLEEKAAVQEAIDEAKALLKEQAPELWAEVGNMAFNNDLSEWEKAGQELKRGGAVDALIKQMQKRGTDELLNLTKTLAFRSLSGQIVPARRAFVHAMNNALTQVLSGGMSYGQACRDAVKELAKSGLRVTDYANGRTMQIDSAVRNAVRTAAGQLTGDIMQENIEASGVPMVQVSAHWGARESHALWQGQVYTVEQFKNVCGYGDPGNPDHIYSYNCNHDHYPFWPGISEKIEYPTEPGPFEVNGRTYSYYQATQKQRAMERAIRAEKRIALTDPEAGNRQRIRQLTAEYKQFSENTGIRAKLERCQVVGYDKGSPVPGGGKIRRNAIEKSKASDIINLSIKEQEKNTVSNKVTGNLRQSERTGSRIETPAAWDDSIGSRAWSKSAKKRIYSAEYSSARGRTETARIYDTKGKLLLRKIGEEDFVQFTDVEIKQMRGSVLTHNHPGGGCFSPNDINMLRRGKLSELRAVTGAGVFRIQAPKTWPRDISNFNKIETEYYEIDGKISKKFYDRARNGEISYVEAELLGQRATVKEFCNRYGIPFRFDAWDEIKEEV